MANEDFIIVSSADSVVKWPPKSLTAMKVSELRAMASDMNVTGASGLSKSDPVATIAARVATGAAVGNGETTETPILATQSEKGSRP